MTVMLPFTPPKIDTPYQRPILTASSHVTKQSAGVAIRSWWRRTMARERLEAGLILRRSEISARNNDAGNKGIPTLELCFEDEGGHEVVLAAFADQSAVVLRAVLPGTHSRVASPLSAGDEFRALPIVLRIASVARARDGRLEGDGRGALTLTMRGTKSPILALGRENDKDGWVNIEAGWTCKVNGIDEDVRRDLATTIGVEASAWAHLAASLPPLASPEAGHSVPGSASDWLREETGCPEGTIVAAPASMPWQSYTRQESADMREFCRDICLWLQMRTEGVCENIDLDLFAAQPGQKHRSSAAPRVRIICRRHDRDTSRQRTMAAHLEAIVGDILASDLSPIAMDRLVGQVERDYRNRRTWLEPDAIARVFAKPGTGNLSNHAVLALRARLDPFWRPPS